MAVILSICENELNPSYYHYIVASVPTEHTQGMDSYYTLASFCDIL